jgi:hypothetical protein
VGRRGISFNIIRYGCAVLRGEPCRSPKDLPCGWCILVETVLARNLALVFPSSRINHSFRKAEGVGRLVVVGRLVDIMA